MKQNQLLKYFGFTLVIVLSIVIFSNNPSTFISKIPLIKGLAKNTLITINSINGTSTVKINGEEYGSTPLEVEALAPGNHKIEMRREVNQDLTFYEPQTFFINLHENTEAIINIEIGPDDNLSGYYLYYSAAPKSTPETGYFSVSSNTSANVFIENNFNELTPIKLSELATGEHNVVISNEGYESVEVPIIIREGFNLNLTVYLLPIPTNLTLP